MHPVARVSINIYRNLRTQQMAVLVLLCTFYTIFHRKKHTTKWYKTECKKNFKMPVVRLQCETILCIVNGNINKRNSNDGSTQYDVMLPSGLNG
jgi:hypothetical protein